MPKPTHDQAAYMGLLLVNELHEIAIDAAAARDRAARIVIEEGRLSDEEEARLVAKAVDLRHRVEVLGYSEQAIQLARASLH